MTAAATMDMNSKEGPQQPRGLDIKFDLRRLRSVLRHINQSLEFTSETYICASLEVLSAFGIHRIGCLAAGERLGVAKLVDSPRERAFSVSEDHHRRPPVLTQCMVPS